MKPRGDERGAAHPCIVLAMSGLLMFVGLALTGVAAIVLTQRSAQAAADLAALAGASAAVSRRRTPARAAGEIAEANGAALAICELAGIVVTVAVTGGWSTPGRSALRRHGRGAGRSGRRVG